MSLMLLGGCPSLWPALAAWLAGAAYAQDGRLVWTEGTPDPAFHPELEVVPLAQVAPDLRWSARDAAALERLRAELEAVRPLVDTFDGELQILSRLEAVIADLPAVQDEAGRALLYQALVFQGYAAHRYFQDTLASDPAAAPYRATLGDAVVPRAWVDAVGVDPERDPTPQDLPDPDALRAFDEVRAAARLAPRATVVARDLPEGAALVVDGRPPEATDRVYVPPGPHWVLVVDQAGAHARARARVASGEELRVEMAPSPQDFAELAAALRQGPEGWALEPQVRGALAQLEAPVFLAVPSEDGPWLYELRGGAAVLVEPPAGGRDTDQSFTLVAGVGGGWLYDGDFYLQHAEVAPYTRGTVNAPTAAFNAGARWQRGLLAVDGGVDLSLPLGEHSTLPTGDRELRPRAQPYAAVGLPWVQVSAGFLFPWHATAGARVSLPLGDHLALAGAVWQGFGLTRPRAEGEPEFEPASARGAWLGVQARMGLSSRS